MANRKPINPELPVSKVVLDALDILQLARYRIKRAADVMDYTRDGSNFTALATALGAGFSPQMAEEIYGRFRSIETTMNGPDFQNNSDIDQGG